MDGILGDHYSMKVFLHMSFVFFQREKQKMIIILFDPLFSYHSSRTEFSMSWGFVNHIDDSIYSIGFAGNIYCLVSVFHFRVGHEAGKLDQAGDTHKLSP